MFQFDEHSSQNIAIYEVNYSTLKCIFGLLNLLEIYVVQSKILLTSVWRVFGNVSLSICHFVKTMDLPFCNDLTLTRGQFRGKLS